MGLVYDESGRLRRGWVWQDPVRSCPMIVPIESGERLMLVDQSRPDVPEEPRTSDYATFDEALTKIPPEARSVVRIHLPNNPEREYFITSGCRVVRQRRGVKGGLEDEPDATIEREDAG